MPELPVSRVRMRALLLVVLALCGGVAAAQAPDYSTLPVGKEQLARSSGAAGGELFRFLGLAGDRIGLLVNPDGYATVAVYDPDGRRLDGYAGSDARVLELTLPKDGLYFASVALRPAGNYIIKLERYHAAAPAAPVAPVLDPAWGLYAQLPGRFERQPRHESAEDAVEGPPDERIRGNVGSSHGLLPQRAARHAPASSFELTRQ